jgi:hypothetical protein
MPTSGALEEFSWRGEMHGAQWIGPDQSFQHFAIYFISKHIFVKVKRLTQLCRVSDFHSQRCFVIDD